MVNSDHFCLEGYANFRLSKTDLLPWPTSHGQENYDSANPLATLFVVPGCTVNHEESGRVSQTLPMSPPRICTHHRMISYRVTEEEHEAGKVRCVKCGSVIPDPHL